MRHTHSLAMAIVACLLFASDGNAARLTAGTARIDLTPPMQMHATLGGYGQRMSRPAEGVHDQVFAKALVVSDGKQRIALLTADILGFPPAFKPALVRQLGGSGWTSRQLILLPSHSHTSIDMNAINPSNVFRIKQIGVYDEQLFQWTVQRCKEVIDLAASELVPVTIGTSSKAIDGWNRNRRCGDGATDNSLTVTRIDTANNKPLAVLVNFTAHPTFMGAEHMLFSGGWPGHLQRSLESMIGRNVNVMYYNGAEGDQSPVARANSGANRWEAAEQYGNGLAEESHALWTTITPRSDNVFDFHSQEIDLPQTSWHPDFMKTGGDEYGLNEELLGVILRLMFPAKTVSGSLRLGDLVIVGVPGEMTAELGLEIKEKTKAITGSRHVAIGGLANEWISYILTEEEYQRGGYEASVSFYGAGLGKCITDGVVAGVKHLER